MHSSDSPIGGAWTQAHRARASQVYSLTLPHAGNRVLTVLGGHNDPNVLANGGTVALRTKGYEGHLR